MKGYYKTPTSSPCKEEDMHFFRRMMRKEQDGVQRNVMVKQTQPHDILISETVVKRWRIVSEEGKLYLGFYEKPMHEMRFQGTECQLSYYVVLEDNRKNTPQKYVLVRIPRWYAYQVLGLDMK